MSFLISDAMAVAAPAASAAHAPADSSFSLIMIVGVFILLYFMLIRPQNKREKEHRDLISKLKMGDEVISSSGILGKLTSVDEQYVKLSVADGVELCMRRGDISKVLPKGTLKSL